MSQYSTYLKQNVSEFSINTEHKSMCDFSSISENDVSMTIQKLPAKYTDGLHSGTSSLIRTLSSVLVV